MKKLIGMTDYVFEQYTTVASDNVYLAMKNCYNHAKFLKQTANKGMFVPCDEDGNVLEIIPFNEHKKGSIFENDQYCRFNKAKEWVLFEGFTFDGHKYLEYKNISLDIRMLEYKTIEDLVEYNLTLK